LGGGGPRGKTPERIKAQVRYRRQKFNGKGGDGREKVTRGGAGGLDGENGKRRKGKIRMGRGGVNKAKTDGTLPCLELPSKPLGT
jgi:hypothetical protein